MLDGMIGWLGGAYLWVMSLHVIFVIFLMASLFMMPRYFVYHQESDPGSPEEARWVTRENALRRIIMNPSITLVWIFGLMLAANGGFWMQGWFGFTRNHYDRIGHFMQGFGPALVARELLLRTSPLAPGKWLFTLVLLSVLGISACYEFTEWWAALAGGDAAGAFLGTQGDVWDTQWDMFMAGIGALVAQVTVDRVHDRQLLRIDPTLRAKYGLTRV